MKKTLAMNEGANVEGISLVVSRFKGPGFYCVKYAMKNPMMMMRKTHVHVMMVKLTDIAGGAFDE